MDDKFAMDVLETMARMFEALTARIEATEKKLGEQCSCRTWTLTEGVKLATGKDLPTEYVGGPE